MRRSRFGLLLAVLGGLSARRLIVDPQGSLYNVRLLPLWFLCVYLMVGWVFAVTAATVVALRWRPLPRSTRWAWHAARMRSLADTAAASPARGPARWAPGAVAGALLAMLGALSWSSRPSSCRPMRMPRRHHAGPTR